MPALVNQMVSHALLQQDCDRLLREDRDWEPQRQICIQGMFSSFSTDLSRRLGFICSCIGYSVLDHIVLTT